MDRLYTAVEAVLDMRYLSGRKEKAAHIAKYKDNEFFRCLLYYACNPLLTYKVSNSSLKRPFVFAPNEPCEFDSIFKVCETLSGRRGVDDETLRQVCYFLDSCSELEAELYTALLTKALRIGVSSKTINEIIPDLIPEWEVQQAFPIEKYPIKPGTWFSLSEKLNGVRATYYKGELIARSGLPYCNLDHITDELAKLGDNMVFDGELVLLDKGSLSDNEAFRVATGIINSDNEDKTQICYRIFDALPLEEFMRGESMETFKVRRARLEWLFSEISTKYISAVPILYSGEDTTVIDGWLERMVSEDKEGLMANLDTTYKCKRHRGILKIKRFYTMDLRILRCEEGDGRLKGTLGALVVDYKGNEVNVGSGFSDEQRVHIWKNRDDIIDTLCEVKYKEISSDKHNKKSLQFPVFVRLRHDKSEESFG